MCFFFYPRDHRVFTTEVTEYLPQRPQSFYPREHKVFITEVTEYFSVTSVVISVRSVVKFYLGKVYKNQKGSSRLPLG
jgi:hypothetical protein